MTWLDYVVLGVLGASVVWGAWRGMVKEVIAVAGWVLAFFAANMLAWPLSNAMPDSIPTPELRYLVGFLAVFVASLAVTTLAGVILSRLVKVIGLRGLDRSLGSVFGAARGVLIVLAFALLAGLTALPRQPLWQDSYSGAPLSRAALALKGWLPPLFADRLSYH